MSHNIGAPASPVPGWYPDPADAQALRSWDAGQPLSAGQPANAGRAPVPWAWAVAATPLILLAVAAVLAAQSGQSGSTSGYIFTGVVVTAVIAVFMSYRDARMLVNSGDLRGAGIAWWSLLSPWAYLWARVAKRSNPTNLDWILLAASAAGWVLIAAIATPVINRVAAANTSFSRVKVQTGIVRGIRSQLGVRAVVDCPQDPPVHPGSTFQCIARASDGSRAMVNVTIQDRNGDYTWRTSQ